MRESVLRTAVEERRTIKESTWAYLKDLGFVQEAIEEAGKAARDPIGYLIAEIDRISAAAPDHASRAMPAGGDHYHKSFEFLQEHERERAEARSLILAKHAAADKSVLEFRARFLDGELLTPERAQAFVSSLANANMPVRWFDEHEISFVDHTTHTRKASVDYRGEVIEFTVQPASIDCRVEKDPMSEEYGKGQMLSVAGDPPEVIHRRRNDVSLPSPGKVGIIAQDGLLDLGYWRGFSGYVRTDSPLGALRELGNRLMKRYRGWESTYATRFVLTGEPPMVYPIRKERGPGGTIVMHMDPWISPESVKTAYSQEHWLQGWMSVKYDDGKGKGKRKAKSKFKRRRRLSPKTLKLLRFVTERIDSRGRRPEDGRALVAEWDAQQWVREWDAQELVRANPRRRASYRGNTRRFWRDYNRALRAVAPETVQKGR